ncbi:hypothetical protein ACEE23_06735 [Corynebacterium sp. 32222D000AT]|uniref:hypothetical protein n=1 Tax=Corynebacterium TaxID=1716 RepID=UPI0025B577BF|nr:hypothetical protein [Corynebacterium confusum]MDD7581560.1 hypothetical protein [Mycobacteriaceae bacterium]MDY5829622.1 hypothetical protein [Corynebacterium sp.]WJY89559.1 hypothetical protein CCONF_05070 [Corynebacterium confusum]
MPRRNRRQRSAPRKLPADGAGFYGAQVQEGPRWSFGQPYVVRQIGAARAVKTYVCPGCNQSIFPGVAHVVAWPKDAGGQADDRRHWHRGCWDRR